MTLVMKQWTAYGTKTKFWTAHFNGTQIATGISKDEVIANATQSLANAFTYLTHPAVVRVATNGEIIVFRYLSPDTAMYEFCRNGQRGSGSCMGKMTDGNTTYRNLDEYADYIVKQYNGVI